MALQVGSTQSPSAQDAEPEHAPLTHVPPEPLPVLVPTSPSADPDAPTAGPALEPIGVSAGGELTAAGRVHWRELTWFAMQPRKQRVQFQQIARLARKPEQYVRHAFAPLHIDSSHCDGIA